VAWRLVGYDFNEQEGTGMLGLVNRETGVKRLISPAVSSFQILPRSSAEPEGVRVVYVVRGRNPSAQDGLWLATLTADDFR
jgi:hypothetical protein